MRQASAFARMLSELPEVSNPGELIVGGTQGALARELPCDIAEEEYQKAEKTVEQELSLPFIAHWEYACPDYQTLLELGVGGILEKSEEEQEKTRPAEEQEYLSAMEKAVGAFQSWLYSLAAFYRGKDDLHSHGKRLEGNSQQASQLFLGGCTARLARRSCPGIGRAGRHSLWQNGSIPLPLLPERKQFRIHVGDAPRRCVILSKINISG